MTDSNGIAELKYIVPWTASFGLWEASASWQIGSKTVSDTMKFRVDYLVSVDSTVLEPAEDRFTDPRDLQEYPVYYKGEAYGLTVKLNVMTVQDPGILMRSLIGECGVMSTVAIFDELGQPVAYTALENDIGPMIYDGKAYHPAWDDGEKFIQFVNVGRPRDFTPDGNFSVTIGANAFSGRASVHGNVLTGIGGVPYCGPTIEHIWIWKDHEPYVKPLGADSLEVSSHVVNSGETFNVTITINGVNPDAHAVAIEFTLKFDIGDLKALRAVEGDFVKQFGDTFFTYQIENDVLVGLIQLPPWPGENGWMRESGTICTIEFEAIYMAPPPHVSSLTLTNAFLVDMHADDLEILSLKHGSVTITG